MRRYFFNRIGVLFVLFQFSTMFVNQLPAEAAGLKIMNMAGGRWLVDIRLTPQDGGDVTVIGGIRVQRGGMIQIGGKEGDKFGSFDTEDKWFKEIKYTIREGRPADKVRSTETVTLDKKPRRKKPKKGNVVASALDTGEVVHSFMNFTSSEPEPLLFNVDFDFSGFVGNTDIPILTLAGTNTSIVDDAGVPLPQFAFDQPLSTIGMSFVDQDVPESSTIFGLTGVAILGTVSFLKRNARR